MGLNSAPSRILNGGQSVDRIVFSSDRGPGYSIFSGKSGITVDGDKIIVSNSGQKETLAYADPSYGAETMLRTEFTIGDRGIGIEKFNDIKVGDLIEAFIITEIKQTLD